MKTNFEKEGGTKENSGEYRPLVVKSVTKSKEVPGKINVTFNDSVITFGLTKEDAEKRWGLDTSDIKVGSAIFIKGNYGNTDEMLASAGSVGDVKLAK
ncbi:hypothetical protein ACFL2U_00055 [Patescibacteria group bacterium]